MSERKIARFVDIRACKSIFSEKSTFVLRSPEHYRRLYEITEGAEGDGNEGSAQIADGGTAEVGHFVCSCWTMLKGSEPTQDEWDIFKKDGRNVVAIISTPSKVCDFLRNKLEMNKESPRFPFDSVEHKEVNYKPLNKVDHTNIFDDVPFAKVGKFEKEKEYRFVLSYTRSRPPLIDSFIFCGGIDYMEKCLANPGINEEEKEELRLIFFTAAAGYGDFTDKQMDKIIANANILFDWQSSEDKTALVQKNVVCRVR